MNTVDADLAMPALSRALRSDGAPSRCLQPAKFVKALEISVEVSLPADETDLVIAPCTLKDSDAATLRMVVCTPSDASTAPVLTASAAKGSILQQAQEWKSTEEPKAGAKKTTSAASKTKAAKAGPSSRKAASPSKKRAMNKGVCAAVLGAVFPT
eukprot:gene19585-23425_t